MKGLLFTSLVSVCAYLTSYSQNTGGCSADFSFTIEGLTIKFSSNDGSANLHHYWSFGDSKEEDGTPGPSHTYAQPGSYRVVHFVKNESQNCWDSVAKEIDLHATTCTIESRFDWKQDSANCLRINFFNQSIPISPNVYFSWKFGDGTSSQDISPSHVYSAPGDYEVCLVIESGNYCRKEFCEKISIVCDPHDCAIEPKFEWKQDSANCLRVKFLNASVTPNPNFRIAWKFGDGGGSYEANPTHVYSAPGEYEVCLLIATANNCAREYCSKIKVSCDRPNCPIEPKFEWKHDSTNCLKIKFINESAPATTNVHYNWKFGDGGESNDVNPTHEYNVPGEYEACLVIESPDNCRKEYCRKIIVTCDNQCNVKANFQWKRDETKWNKIHFANLSWPVPNIWKTSWTYGDGSASNDFNSFHTYEKPGLYEVCLKVQSLNGCISEYCDSVIVKEQDCEGQSKFRYQRAPDYDLGFKFEPDIQSSNRKYYWAFGDGTTSTEVSPLHKFPAPGLYIVCLTVHVYNTNGLEPCRSKSCMQIWVGPDCNASELKFEYKFYPDKPGTVSFIAVSNQAIKDQRWIISLDTSNGSPNPWHIVLEANDPTYTFKEKGWYVVCLKATMENGCEKSYCERIFVEKTERATTNVADGLIGYPNPAINNISFELNLVTAQLITVQIFDNNGRLRLQSQFGGHAGGNTITLSIDKLTRGLYFALIRFGNQTRWLKFEKG